MFVEKRRYSTRMPKRKHKQMKAKKQNGTLRFEFVDCDEILPKFVCLLRAAGENRKNNVPKLTSGKMWAKSISPIGRVEL